MQSKSKQDINIHVTIWEVLKHCNRKVTANGLNIKVGLAKNVENLSKFDKISYGK